MNLSGQSINQSMNEWMTERITKIKTHFIFKLTSSFSTMTLCFKNPLYENHGGNRQTRFFQKRPLNGVQVYLYSDISWGVRGTKKFHYSVSFHFINSQKFTSVGWSNQKQLWKRRPFKHDYLWILPSNSPVSGKWLRSSGVGGFRFFHRFSMESK